MVLFSGSLLHILALRVFTFDFELALKLEIASAFKGQNYHKGESPGMRLREIQSQHALHMY